MKTPKPVTVPCGHCRGAGHIELTGVHAETLVLLSRTPGTPTGKQLADLGGCSNEAMCNRLRVLERYGLAESVRYGRERRWKAAAG